MFANTSALKKHTKQKHAELSHIYGNTLSPTTTTTCADSTRSELDRMNGQRRTYVLCPAGVCAPKERARKLSNPVGSVEHFVKRKHLAFASHYNYECKYVALESGVAEARKKEDNYS